MSQNFLIKNEGSEDLKDQSVRSESSDADAAAGQNDPALGLWSRSVLFRIIVWIVVVQGMLISSTFLAAYLSGYPSVMDMINSFQVSIWVQ